MRNLFIHKFASLKKLAVIFVLLIYSSTTIGATVTLHYCMDEFVGWSLLHKNDGTCGKCGMEEKDKEGCCNDEQKHFKLKIDQQKSNAGHFINFIPIPIQVSPLVLNVNIHSYSKITDSYPSCHAPPGSEKKKLNIFNCVFLV
jgi:hypothetical protein